MFFLVCCWTMVQLGNDGPPTFSNSFRLICKCLLPCNVIFYWASRWFNYICQKSSICPYHWYCLWFFFYLQLCFHVEGIGFKRTLRRHFVSLFLISTLCFLVSWIVFSVSFLFKGPLSFVMDMLFFYLYCYPQTTTENSSMTMN